MIVVVWPHVAKELTTRLVNLRHTLERADPTDVVRVARAQAQIQLCEELLQLPTTLSKEAVGHG